MDILADVANDLDDSLSVSTFAARHAGETAARQSQDKRLTARTQDGKRKKVKTMSTWIKNNGFNNMFANGTLKLNFEVNAVTSTMSLLMKMATCFMMLHLRDN